MRGWVAVVVACAGCGDNLTPCERPMALVDGLLVPSGECGDHVPDGCGAPPQGLVSGRHIWSYQVAVDATHVYFTDYHADALHLVMRRPLDGGPLETIAERPPGVFFGSQLALHAGHAFWSGEIREAESNGLFSTPIAGGDSELLVEMPECAAHGVAVDAINAYGGTFGCNEHFSQVVAQPHDGRPAWIAWRSSVRGDEIQSISVGGGDVFLSTTNGLYKVAAAGGEPIRLLAERTYSTAYADGALYALLERGVYQIRDDGVHVAMLTFPVAGDGPNARHVAIDGNDLYASFPPRLYHIDRRKPGSAPSELVGNMGGGAGAMVAADGAAYWGAMSVVRPGDVEDGGGGVLRVAAPCAP